MAYSHYNMTAPRQGQWMPMYPQHPVRDDGVYKPATTSHTLEVGDDGIPAYLAQTFAQKHFSGLKRSLRAFGLGAVIVLSVNVGWLGYARSKYGIANGTGTIKAGDCQDVKKLNTWFHLLINVLSTLLLTGSNAFMAAYSAPTRQEIDKAHARRKWLHVGCMSLRNMTGIAWHKTLLVLVLALSSVPFHLLYNSLVYAELSVNEYNWAVITEGFLDGASFTLSTLPDVEYISPEAYAEYDSETQYWKTVQDSASTWERLDPKACIQAYANAFVSERRTVVIVSSAQNDTNSILAVGAAQLQDSDVDNNWWICSLRGQDGGHLTCNPQDYISKAASWKVFNYPVSYCLSERTNDTCSVKFNMQIMLVVIAFNALKVAAMIAILLSLDARNLVACVGDAAVSFIRQPDQTTAGICLADRRHIDQYWWHPGPRIYNGGGRRRWGAALSKKRWILFTLLMLFSWGIVLILGIWGFSNTKSKGIALTVAGLSSLGFGTLNQHALAFPGSADISTIALSIIANVPQVFLALIYLMYMGVMTAMFNAVDWAGFSKKAQTLMVSSPTAKQRGTWLWGAPPFYGLLLLALQTLLHWFVSQSLFVVQVVVLDENGRSDPTSSLQTNLGYSPMAIIASVIASGILFFSAIMFMLMGMPRDAPPVVSTCSAAISAACHVPKEMMSDAVVFEKLGWGETSNSPNEVGHCSLGPAKMFEAGYGYAGPPILGKAYAGLKRDGASHISEEWESAKKLR